MTSFAASAHRHRICLLEFSIVLKLKDNKTEIRHENVAKLAD